MEDMFYTKAVRVFYRKSDSSIVWSHTLKCLKGTDGKFPAGVDVSLADVAGRFGGFSDDYSCIEEADRADEFLSSDINKVDAGQLVIGIPRAASIPPPPLDVSAEINDLKKRMAGLEAKGVRTL